MSGVNDFADRYRIASSDPTSNNDEGDLCFNTTSNELRVYNGSAWQGGVTATGNLAGLGANTFTGAQTFISSQTFDGRDLSVDGAKLDGIETAATADQTAAEIRTLVENAGDSNVFTDADHTKLNGIEASATADQTAAEIRTLVESASDSNVFTDADHSKLNGIEASATADQTKSDIDALNINADQVDGLHAASFLRSDADDSASGSYSFSNSYNEFGNGTGSVTNDGNWNARVNIAGTTHARLDVKSVSDGIITCMYAHTGHSSGKIGTRSNHNVTFVVNNNDRATLTTGGQLSTTTQGILWGASNDGAGSGLDADTLDGQQGAYYQNASNLNAGTVPDARFPATLPAVSGANLTNLPASGLGYIGMLKHF
jgi:hypothetical protein